MKILMRNIGMTLYVIHKLRERGIDNVKVNMDWQHLIMNGENLAEYAALLAAEGLLGHQHANSGWGTFDDDNMVGATAFMETLELALELRRARLRRQRRAARLRPLPVHRGRGRGGAALGAAVALHRRRRGEDRRRGAARGAAAQGRGRARTSSCTRRSARDVTLVGLDVGTTGVKAIASLRDRRGARAGRGGVPALDAAARLGRAGSRGLVARGRGGARRAVGGRAAAGSA